MSLIITNLCIELHSAAEKKEIPILYNKESGRISLYAYILKNRKLLTFCSNFRFAFSVMYLNSSIQTILVKKEIKQTDMQNTGIINPAFPIGPGYNNFSERISDCVKWSQFCFFFFRIIHA